MSTYSYAQFVSIHQGVKCTYLCLESRVEYGQGFQFHEFTSSTSLHADVHAVPISPQSLCVAFLMMSIQMFPMPSLWICMEASWNGCKFLTQLALIK